MKKLISLFMALILIVSAVSAAAVYAAEDQLNVTVNGKNGQAYSVGDEIELMLNLNLGDTEILNGDIRLTYDAAFLEFVEHKAAGKAEPEAEAYSFPAGIYATNPILNFSKVGQIRFNFTTSDKHGIGTLTGNHTFLARFRFKVKAAGSVDITAVIQTMCDTDEKYIYSKGAVVGTYQPVFTTSLAIAPAASVNGTAYPTFAEAVDARTSDNDVVVLLDDIGEYTLAAGMTLKVEKNIYELVVKASNGQSVTSSEDEGITVYTTTAISYSTTLSLADSIDINFKIKNLPGNYDQFKITYTFDNVTTTKDCTNQTENVFVVAACNANQMNDPVHIEVTDPSSATILRYDYSIKTYCDSVINDSRWPAKLKDLCTAVELYGAEAQKYFGSESELIMDDSTVIDSLEDTPEDYKWYASGSCSSVKGISASLSMKSKTELNVYIKPDTAEGALPLTVKVDGNEINTDSTGDLTLTPQTDGRLLLRISGIRSVDLAKTYAISMSNTDGELVFYCSPLSYAYSERNTTTDGLNNLCKALYNYYLKADAFFG